MPSASTTIDQYSLCAVPLRQRYQKTELGTATAFVWNRNDCSHLITNWHVVTGRNFQTGKNLHARGGRPDRLFKQFNPKILSLEKWCGEIELFDAEGQPRWLVHPAFGHAIDVVAIPLPHLNQDCPYSYFPINDMPQLNLDVQVGMDVFVLGYPFGDDPPAFPVWKRGSIASEPQLASSAEKYFLIDTASRPGMSGAPVILRTWGTHLTDENNVITTPGSATLILGIYSGRLVTQNPLDVQLGLVWPRSLIEEIIDGGRRDDRD